MLMRKGTAIGTGEEVKVLRAVADKGRIRLFRVWFLYPAVVPTSPFSLHCSLKFCPSPLVSSTLPLFCVLDNY